MKHLKIYFTSDVHGYIYPTDYRNSVPKPMGFLSLIEQFHKDSNTLIIDGGDTIQGSPFTTFLSRHPLAVHPISTIMNTIHYDYVTLGNHDFNYGYQYLKSYINPLQATVLCANVTDSKGELAILPYALHTLENNLKVGIIGFTTDFIPLWEQEKNLMHFAISDTYTSIQTHFSTLQSQVDLMIGIYHGGFEYNLESHTKLSDSSENIAYKICQNFDFDLLLTAHQHLPISNQTLFGTHIVQTPHNGTHFTQVLIDFDDSNGSVSIRSELIPTTLDYHKVLYDELLPLETSVQSWLDRPVGKLNLPLVPSTHLQMAQKGSLLANFINQIQLNCSGADLSCCSLANHIKGFDTDVTIRDIVSTYPYPNTLVVIEITGQILRLMLENVARYFVVTNEGLQISEDFLKPKVTHYNYDYFSNLFYTFDVTKPVGSRVASLIFKDCAVTDEMTFTLVMNNYRHSGVGGYDLYKSCKVVQEILIEMPEIMINYFTKYKDVTVDDTNYFKIITT